KDPSGAISGVTTVTIAVKPVNDPPVAANDSYTVFAGASLTVTLPGVLGNDTDVENDPLTATLVASAKHGTLVLHADGSFIYTPAAGYSGPDSFTYRAKDSHGGLSNTATVSLTVIPNHVPSTAGDAYTVNEDTILTTAAPGVLGND